MVTVNKLKSLDNQKKLIGRGVSREMLDLIFRKDTERKNLQKKYDELAHQSSQINKQVYQTVNDSSVVVTFDEHKEKIKSLKQEIKAIKSTHENVMKELLELLQQIPNIPNNITPIGNDEKANIVIREKSYSVLDSAIPHWEVNEKLGLIDFKAGAKITGSGFPVYIGNGAKLQRSLVAFFLQANIDADFIEYRPPHFVNEMSAYSTGQLPDKDGQMYLMNQDKLYAIPTAEVPVTNIWRDTILEEKNLPIKATAHSQCFRREAGSYGKHVRGLNRLHEFEKVEIVVIEHPEKSYERLHEMVSHVTRNILEKLELPYRVVQLCTGDLGFASACTYDLEVWSAGQKRWLEVSSISNFETFQSRRLNSRFKTKDGLKYTHTLNGSALALPRIFAALIENRFDGNKVVLPKVLQSYYGAKYVH